MILLLCVSGPCLISPQAAEQAFIQGVEAICQTPVSKGAEVAAEVQLIRASVAFGLYVIKSCPELKNTVSDVMNTFLNRRVGTWVTKQGGWVSKFFLISCTAIIDTDDCCDNTTKQS